MPFALGDIAKRHYLLWSFVMKNENVPSATQSIGTLFQHGFDRLVSYPQLNPDFGIRYSRQHLGRLEKAGGFPQRVQESANRIGWLESELRQFISDRAAARTAVAA